MEEERKRHRNKLKQNRTKWVKSLIVPRQAQGALNVNTLTANESDVSHFKSSSGWLDQMLMRKDNGDSSGHARDSLNVRWTVINIMKEFGYI